MRTSSSLAATLVALAAYGCGGGAALAVSVEGSDGGDAGSDTPTDEFESGTKDAAVVSPRCAQGAWSQPEYKSLGYGGYDATDHQTTLLHDGRVMLGSGRAIFDPRTSTYTSLPSFEPRWLAELTVLADGRVLMAGGGYGDGTSRDVFIIDPDKRTKKPAAPMLAARGGHLQFLLPNGHVLVVGGAGPDGFAPLVGAEVYDPASDQWTRNAAPKEFEYNGGDVGWTYTFGGPIGGADWVVVGDNAYTYRWKTDTWEAAGLTLPFAGQFAFPLSKGLVLFAGTRQGKPGEPNHVMSAMWNSTTHLLSGTAMLPQWVARPPGTYMTSPIMQASSGALLPCGEVHVLTADNDDRVHALLFDPERNSWRESTAKIPEAWTVRFFTETPMADGGVLAFPAQLHADGDVYFGPVIFAADDPADAGTAGGWR